MGEDTVLYRYFGHQFGVVKSVQVSGYVYDEETGLYYLRSRYYRAEICRFVNEDALIASYTYSYANYNPVLFTDANGKIAEIAIPVLSPLIGSALQTMGKILLGVGVTIGAVTSVYTLYDISKQLHKFISRDFYNTGIDQLFLCIRRLASPDGETNQQLLEHYCNIALDILRTALEAADNEVWWRIGE